jgi:hypothetical protein
MPAGGPGAQRRGRVVTFDRGMVALHDDVAELIPT